MQMESIAAKIAAFEDLRTQADELKEQLSELTKRRDAAEDEVILAILDAQDQAGVEALRVNHEGRNYSVSVKQYYSIPKEKKDLAFICLRDLGMGDLIQEKVDDRTLTKELNTVFEENGCQFPEEYDNLFQCVGQYEKLTLRRVKA